VVKAVFDKPVKKALDNATNDPNRRLLTGGTVGDLNKAKKDASMKEAREHDEPGESGPEVEKHNAYLRKMSGNRETTQQRMARKAAEQRARGAHRRPRPGTYG
jgi:hypothetical protein